MSRNGYWWELASQGTGVGVALALTVGRQAEAGQAEAGQVEAGQAQADQAQAGQTPCHHHHSKIRRTAPHPADISPYHCMCHQVGSSQVPRQLLSNIRQADSIPRHSTLLPSHSKQHHCCTDFHWHTSAACLANLG